MVFHFAPVFSVSKTRLADLQWPLADAVKFAFPSKGCVHWRVAVRCRRKETSSQLVLIIPARATGHKGALDALAPISGPYGIEAVWKKKSIHYRIATTL